MRRPDVCPVPPVRIGLRRPAPGFFQQALGAVGVVHATGAEPRQRGGGLLGRAAAFANHVQHFAGHVERHHAVPAHGRKLENLRVRQVVVGVGETQRVFDAVTMNAAAFGDIPRAFDRPRR